MNDYGRTREQLLEEVETLRRQVAELRDAELERRQTEEALRESERRYRELADSLPETVYEMDFTGRLTFGNRAGLEQFGYSLDEFARGLNAVDLVVAEDRDRAIRNIAGALAGRGSEETQEYTALRKDGSTFPVVICSSRIVRNGLPVGLRGFLVDISARKRAELALRESEARFRAIFERSAIGVVVSNLDGLALAVNPAMQRMLGYSEEEFRQMTFSDATYPEDLPRNLELARELAAGRRDYFQIEKRFIRRDGELMWGLVTASLVRGEKGEPLFAISMVEDVTERKQLEEQLLRAQRLETAGRIAGQVAHDFNNLLGPMTAYPDLIKMQLPEGHPALEYCDAMVNAAERMAEINENLMTLGRRGLLDQQPTDLNRLVEQAVGQMGGLFGEVELELRLAPDLLPVSGSPGQLLRMIANLLTNAREAMEEGGQLSVATENVYLDRAKGSHNRVEVGEYVRLQVRDSGCGIPPEIRSKIFDPFFTTKSKAGRRGSGLGLSIVQTIVEDHQGYLDLESEVEEGTVFSVYLPVGREALLERTTEGLPGGQERVLVVDDDQLQREVSRASLSKLGYQVETAASGEEAVAYLQQHEVDLLILDMVMPPGMDGAETYRQLLKVRPGQRAIIVSGFAESDRVRKAQALGAGAYIRKPVKLERLARAVREELDRREACT